MGKACFRLGLQNPASQLGERVSGRQQSPFGVVIESHLGQHMPQMKLRIPHSVQQIVALGGRSGLLFFVNLAKVLLIRVCSKSVMT